MFSVYRNLTCNIQLFGYLFLTRESNRLLQLIDFYFGKLVLFSTWILLCFCFFFSFFLFCFSIIVRVLFNSSDIIPTQSNTEVKYRHLNSIPNSENRSIAADKIPSHGLECLSHLRRLKKKKTKKKVTQKSISLQDVHTRHTILRQAELGSNCSIVYD